MMNRFIISLSDYRICFCLQKARLKVGEIRPIR
jgi:hypothetical protein